MIPMTPTHQRLVMSGIKTTTLRGTQWFGVHRMEARNGTSLGYLRVLQTSSEPVVWTDLDEAQQTALAKTEGYPSISKFINGAIRIAGAKEFFDGKRGMYLHTIEPVGQL